MSRAAAKGKKAQKKAVRQPRRARRHHASVASFPDRGRRGDGQVRRARAEPVTDGEDQQTQQDARGDSDAIQTISNGKERKKYCYTILAYGVDNDAGGSDTNMLVRFDAENKKIDVVSCRATR